MTRAMSKREICRLMCTSTFDLMQLPFKASWKSKKVLSCQAKNFGKTA